MDIRAAKLALHNRMGANLALIKGWHIQTHNFVAPLVASHVKSKDIKRCGQTAAGSQKPQALVNNLQEKICLVSPQHQSIYKIDAIFVCLIRTLVFQYGLDIR